MTPSAGTFPVTETTTLGAYRVLGLRAPQIARDAQPGQFLQVAVRNGAALLRRPFSLYGIDPDTGIVSIAFDRIGEGTRWLAERRPGDALDVVGPLGSGFPLEQGGGTHLLVGGGYGTAALVSLAQRLASAGGSCSAIIGARTAARVFSDPLLARLCDSVQIATDDGSAGTRGIVTDLMQDAIRRTRAQAVHACGPMRMLEAVAREAERAGVPSYLAVEEFMACGVGVCWTCVLPVRVDGTVAHLRSCTEGPVFEGAAVAWA